MRGRRPKPTARRRLEGNPSHRPLNLREPIGVTPGPEFDTPPEVLDGNVIAMHEWQRLAPALRAARAITESDRNALVAMCLEWARYIDATHKVRDLGMIIKAPSGYPIVNPYLSIATKALAGCNKLWPELGLTPSSRARIIATPEDAAHDPFAEFDAPPLRALQ